MRGNDDGGLSSTILVPINDEKSVYTRLVSQSVSQELHAYSLL